MKSVYTILMACLIGLSLGVLFTGLDKAESAPQQAVIVGGACFVAILARMAQAAAHHAINQEKEVHGKQGALK